MHRVKTIIDKARPLASVTFRTLAQNEYKYQTPLRQGLPLQRDFVRNYAAPVAAEPFLNGSTSNYVEEMYNSWLQDPNSVHKSWDAFFRGAAAGAAPGQAYVSPPTLGGSLAQYSAPAGATGTADAKVIDDHLAVQAIIRSYQVRGHFKAHLDPLSISTSTSLDQISTDHLSQNVSYHRALARLGKTRAPATGRLLTFPIHRPDTRYHTMTMH